MKSILKKILFIRIRCILMVSFLLLGNVKSMAQTKLISEKNVEYHDVLCEQFYYPKFYKQEVAYDCFLEDSENLVYLLETAYAGFNDMTSKGYNSEHFLKDCKNKFKNQETITVSEISNYYFTYLKNYINDTHCFIESSDFHKNFIQSKKVFFSDFYVEKKEGKLLVYKADYLNFPVNTEVEIQKDYLFKYPSEGENIYRVGKLIDSTVFDESIFISFDNKEYELKCKYYNYFEKQQTLEDILNYKEIETDKTGYIGIKTFIDLPKDSDYQNELAKIYIDFENAGKRFRTKQNVILDLRSNGGGHSSHPANFLNNLVSDKKIKNFDSFDCVFLMSPAIYQVMQTIIKKTYSKKDQRYKEFMQIMNLYQTSKRTEFLLNNKNGRKKVKSKFKGNLIIVTDKGTASSSELIISYAKELFGKSNQIVLVGENTLGCFSYGNIFHYQLMNSGIAIGLAQFKMENPPVVEGIGFLPDYWATNDDIVQALIKITGDEDLKEKLKNINTRANVEFL